MTDSRKEKCRSYGDLSNGGPSQNLTKSFMHQQGKWNEALKGLEQRSNTPRLVLNKITTGIVTQGMNADKIRKEKMQRFESHKLLKA